MSTLAFFPWLRLSGVVAIDEVSLVPYVRSRAPFAGELQATVDTLLSRYTTPPNHPVTHAVLALPDKENPTRDLTDEEVENLFSLRELLTVSGLSARTFFSHGVIPYSNSHLFSLVVQRFQNPASGISVTSRRRDGNSKTYWSADTYRVSRPDHIPSNLTGVDLDLPLLQGLLKARTEPDFERLEEAIAGFNLSNTDSSEVFQRVELMLMNGAFERLFDCRSGKEDDLAHAFIQAVVPGKDLLASAFPRFGSASVRGPRTLSVREVWIRDFFRSRGDHAHGRVKAARTSVWSLTEHLLLGAFIFPFALKAALAASGNYVMDQDDRDFVDVFETLATTDLLKPKGHEASPASWPWNEVMEKIQHRRLSRALESLWKEGGD